MEYAPIVILTIVCVLLVIFVGRLSEDARGKRVAQIRTNCTRARDAIPILVLMTTTTQTRDVAVHTLVRLFESARCPYRVFVSIHETRTTPENPLPNLVDMYTDIVSKRAFSVPQTHVRVYQSGSDVASGPLQALDRLFRASYRLQPYTLVMHDATDLVDEWDALCIETIRVGEQRLGSVVLTCVPSTNEFVRFPVVSRMSSAHLPVVGGLPLSQTKSGGAPDIVPSLLVTLQFCFLPSSAILLSGVFVPHDNDTWVLDGVDYLVSARLAHVGFTFAVPTRVLARCAPKDAFASYWATRDALRAFVASHETVSKTMLRAHRALRARLEKDGAFEAAVGINFKRGVALGRARLGMTRESTMSEIVKKFGSIGAFHNARSQFM